MSDAVLPRGGGPRRKSMLITLGIILLIAWVLGFTVFHVASGLIHILLVLAVIAVIWHFVSGRRTTV